MLKMTLHAFTTLVLCRKSCLHVFTPQHNLAWGSSPQSNAGGWQVCDNSLGQVKEIIVTKNFISKGHALNSS